jgi:hypothetical protein
VVSKCDEPDAEILLVLQLAGFKDMGTDLFDILRRGVDIAALAARAVLDKNEISVNRLSEGYVIGDRGSI